MQPRLATALHILCSLAGLAAGTVYLTRSEFMPYHAQVVDMQWQSVPPRMQSLLLAMVHAMGAGFLSFGVASLALLAPALRGERWASYALLVLSVTMWLPVLLMTIELRGVAPNAATPIVPAALLLLLPVLAALLRLLSPSSRSVA